MEESAHGGGGLEHGLSQWKRAPMVVVVVSTLFLNGRERPWR